MKATEKQVNFALYLMKKCGLPTDKMQSIHKSIGAYMGERDGRSVTEWLSSLERGRISKIIDDLQTRVEKVK